MAGARILLPALPFKSRLRATMNRREFARFAGAGLFGLAGCGGSIGTTEAIAQDPAVGPPRDELVTGGAQRVFAPDGRRFELVPLHNTIDVFDTRGTQVARIGDPSRAPTRAVGDVSAPVAAAWDETGARLLVLERGNGRIQAFDATGTSLGVLAAVDAASDLAIDPQDGSLLVALSTAHRIQLLSARGGPSGTIGSFGTQGSGLNGPVSVALAPNGDVHVVDSGSASVKVFTAGGGFVGSYGAAGDAKLVGPRAVRFDAAGRIWVADTFAAAVLVFDAGGNLVSRLSPLLANGRPASPVALCPRVDGTMYAAVIEAA
jgi:hypothetical protein